MCGRFGGPPRTAFKTWGLTPPSGYRQSFNIAPSSFQPVVLKEKQYQLALMKWGLVPNWSKEPRVKFSTINTRAESITTSPAFRESFNKRRCLIPAIGYYEWQRHEDGTKQPYFIHLNSRPFFCFAGIWDSWKDASGKELQTFSIVTCNANEMTKQIHNRMPVIVSKEAEDMWVNGQTPLNSLESIMKPYVSKDMDAYKVSNEVNNPMNDDPSLIDKEPKND